MPTHSVADAPWTAKYAPYTAKYEHLRPPNMNHSGRGHIWWYEGHTWEYGMDSRPTSMNTSPKNVNHATGKCEL